MKKVFLMVELIDENGGHVYAIKYTGVMTRRNVYAKLTQDTGCPEPEYIKVSKFDTIDKTKEWSTVFSDRHYLHILVPCDTGMDDNRIQKSAKLFPDEILEAVQHHVQENNEFLATL